MRLEDAYRRVRERVERVAKGCVYVVSEGNCVRVGDIATNGSRFHMELRREEGAEFLFSLSIYLREFDKVIESHYKGKDDFADGKWSQYTHITWNSSPSIRICFVKPSAADDGVWKDCVFELMDACVDEYVGSFMKY